MRNTMTTRLAALASAAVLTLSACSGADDSAKGDDTATMQNGNETLASVLSDLDDSGTVRQAIKDSGLATILDGSGVYSLLAPNDAAFEALGDDGKRLMQDDQRPLMVALLREHILPGHITPEAIDAAIEQQGGEVEMTTLGGGTIAFKREGDTLVATSPAGKMARISGAAQAGSNGTVIPIDTVLVPAAAQD